MKSNSQSPWFSVMMSFSITIGLLSVINEVHAAASLAFSPQRVILEDNSRTSVLRLTNRGDEVGSFRVSMVDLIYGDDGSVTPTSQLPDGYPSARPYVRFSPSQVRLKPGESQNIRVLLKRPNAIPDGELRVHISMEGIPNAVSVTELTGPDKRIIKSQYAIGEAVAIPLIIRRGVTSAEGAIHAATRTPSGVKLVLARSGNQSLYTNIEIYANKVDKNTLIGSIKGVSVPVPNLQRGISVNVKKPSNQPYIVVLKEHYSGEVIAQKHL